MKQNRDIYNFSIDDLPYNIVVYEYHEGNFKFRDINNKALATEQINKEDVLGKYITDVFPGVIEFGLFDVLLEVYKTGQKNSFSVSFYQDERISGWRENEVIKLNDEFILVTYKNVSQRKALEHKLTTLGIIIDNGLSEVYLIDATSYKITYCNKEAQKNIQYTQEEILNLHPWELKTLMSKEELIKTFQSGQKYMIIETKHQRKDGTYYDVEARIQKMNIEGTEQFVIIVLDISHKKMMEDQLSLSNEILENISEAIVVTNLNAKIIDINPAYTAITGYKKEQMMGKNPSVLKSGRHQKEFYKKMWRDLKSKGSWSGEIWDRKKTGEIFPKMLYLNTIYDRAEKPKYYVGIFQDISEIKQNEESLRKLAYYDPLTGLSNRTNFELRLEDTMLSHQRRGVSGALLLLDLDNFKLINDSLGHVVGDELLVQVARRLKKIIRKSDFISRIGGDEFTIILSEPISNIRIHKVAQGILDTIKEPFYILGQEIFVTTSIGLTLFPDDGLEKKDIIKNADLAMYQSKNEKKGGYKFFKYEMNAATLNFLRTESDLRKALHNDEIILHYQPKIDPYNNAIVSVEALVRWNHPTKGLLYPDAFLDIAEDSGLINPMGEIILQKALREIKQLNEELNRTIGLAVNLSTKQFTDENLQNYIFDLIHSVKFDANLLELEITESLIMEDLEKAIDTMYAFVNKGIAISIDDFGTGYSSLNYLKKFPIKYLKIDRSFVQDINTDEDDRAIVSAVISMAKSLGIAVIAEGVETVEHERFLKQKNCTLCQGYLYSKALSIEALKTFIQSYPSK